MPENVVTVAGAAQAVLRCRAVGYPPPIVRWSKDGVQLQATDRLSIESDGTLTLRPVRPEDHGTYRCDAHNYNGTISAEANIFINGEFLMKYTRHCLNFSAFSRSDIHDPTGKCRRRCGRDGEVRLRRVW